MIQIIKSLIDLLRRFLKVGDAPASPGAVPAEQEEQLTEGAPAEQVEQPAEPAAPPSPPIWRRFVSAEQSHLGWLWRHPWVIGIAVAVAVALVFAEKWLIQTWQRLFSQADQLRGNLAGHPVALIGVGIVLFWLLFGLRWLRYVDDFVVWLLGSIRRRPGRSAFLGGVLLLIALWMADNYNTWVVLPFTVGQLETQTLNGEKAAVQLISELNQVGVGRPNLALTLVEPLEPRTPRGSVTLLSRLELGECEEVLRGPGDFRRQGSIAFNRVLAGSQGSRLDLGNLSIGPVNIPSQLFAQPLLKILPTGYREFSGQIHEDNGELEISISLRKSSDAWRVTGPSDAFPEMMEYLALRMALDLNPELIRSSELDASPSDRDMAFAMGNRAFRNQHYRRAWAFFELASRFAPLDEKVGAMLALARYHLALEEPADAPTRFDSALQAMEAAVRKDPKGDNSVLRSYLACLYYRVGEQTKAEAELDVFNAYLKRSEVQNFDARVEALKQLPLRGPGRHLSVAGDRVVFVDEVGDIREVIGDTAVTILKPAYGPPRQIATYGGPDVLFVTLDGWVYAYRVTDGEPQLKTLVGGLALQGVQQIGESVVQQGYTHLFFLNRSGEVYWCDPNANPWRVRACPPEKSLVTDLKNVRQIFPAESFLYMLAGEGDVWRTQVSLDGQASEPYRLIEKVPVREIFVADDDTLYLLYDNGNVGRYYDDGRAETEDLKLIDEGTGTAQIFAAGGYLYLLKSDGAVWRINNPRNPGPDDFTKIEIVVAVGSATVQNTANVTIQNLAATTFREMFVTAQGQEGGEVSDSRTVYLLTDRRVLLRGSDTGGARMVLTQLYIPDSQQAAVGQ
jgi:tetratricopeptide (TPR) repeat protein